MYRLLTPSDYRPMPWKNGGGRTIEIAAYPIGATLDEFLWRVSIADVERDGPFSRFPGIDRTIVLLEGAGMRLRSGTRDIELTTRFVPHDLSGDDAIECTLVAGPSRDFNAMFRRGRARGRVVVVRCRRLGIRSDVLSARVCGGGSARMRDRGACPTAAARGSCAARRGDDSGRRSVDRCPAPRFGRRGARRRRRMPMRLFAADALTPRGWQRDVVIDVALDGTIERVEAGGEPEGAERVPGPLVPGMPNLHSHAFQRAIAGRTGRASADGDSFWTWRQAMYAFLDRIDADAFEAIAAQAYLEMLKAGYTAVAEFHYVHHDPQGKAYADPAELARRIAAAAGSTGIALTLLPVFYAHADFGGAPPTPRAAAVRAYGRLLRDSSSRRSPAMPRPRLETRRRAAQLARRDPDELGRSSRCCREESPIHIHAAEQQREVAACVAWSGARPVEWLLEHAPDRLRAGASCTRRT
jgi:environmental stress-induced protein Ves